MEVEKGSCEKVNGFYLWLSCFMTILSKLRSKVIMSYKKVKKIGEDDPRRILHSCKVGLTLTLVCIFYYVTPLYDGFGASAVWAVITVVVVMEFTVGGTLSKGLNRAFATLPAGALGLGAHYVAILCGKKSEPIFMGIFIFFLSSAAAFLRFIPEVKKRYDYGVSVFILTFSLVAVSGYRVEDVIEFAHQRLSTIAIGVAICMSVSSFVFPFWAGDDLRHLTTTNLEKLANFLHGMRDKYFGEDLEDRSYFQSYNSALNSKTTEEVLVNLAKWEPGHSGFGFRHPWKQYLVIGASIRRCACLMDSLAAFITTLDKSAPLMGSNPKPKPDTEEQHSKIRSACADMSSETAKALLDLANTIKSRSAPAMARLHVAAAEAAAEKMKAALSNGAEGGIIHVATIGSLVGEITRSTEEIVGAVEELARLAGFKSYETISKATVLPLADGESPHATITVVG